VELIFWLLFAHYLADYPLQGEFLALNKGKSRQILFAHAMIWTGTLSIVLLLHGVFDIWIVLFALLIPHFIIDEIKARNLLFYPNLSMWSGLAIDQSFHFLQIIAVYLIVR
jgi:hypothetical protein